MSGSRVAAARRSHSAALARYSSALEITGRLAFAKQPTAEGGLVQKGPVGIERALGRGLLLGLAAALVLHFAAVEAHATRYGVEIKEAANWSGLLW
jgi:hypothetical protein